jgi:hypothetical protein
MLRKKSSFHVVSIFHNRAIDPTGRLRPGLPRPIRNVYVKALHSGNLYRLIAGFAADGPSRSERHLDGFDLAVGGLVQNAKSDRPHCGKARIRRAVRNAMVPQPQNHLDPGK